MNICMVKRLFERRFVKYNAEEFVVTPRRVMLLFHESQHLVERNGFLFWYIQNWLRESQNQKVMAVFVGIIVALANFYKDPLTT